MLIFLLCSSAQAEELNVNAHTFRPAIDSQYFLWLNETGLAKDNVLHFKGVFSHTSRPLVYTGYDGTEIDFLHSVSQLDLLGSYVYGDVRIGVNLPIYAYIEGESPTGENISQSSIGDLLFDVKYRYKEGKLPIGLAFALRSTLPTSGSTAPVVSSKSIAEVELMVDKEVDAFQLVVNIGHRYQQDFAYELAQFGSQFFYRGGVSYTLRPDMGISTEFVGAYLYESGESPSRSQEIMLSSWGKKSDFSIQGGVGLGLGKGIGTPDWRAMAGIQYFPKAKPRDCDRDGIPDTRDMCPNTPEDIDGVDDDDGCADDTWMKVIFVDQYGIHVPRQVWNNGTQEEVSDTPIQIKEHDFVLTATLDGYQQVEETIALPQGKAQTLVVPVVRTEIPLQIQAKDQEGNPISDVRWRIVPRQETFFGDELHVQENMDQTPFFGDELHMQENPDGKGFFGDELHIQQPSEKPFFGDELHYELVPSQNGFFGDELHFLNSPDGKGFFGDELHMQENPDGKGFFGDELHFQRSPFLRTFFGDELHSFPPMEYDLLIYADGYSVQRQALSLTGNDTHVLSLVMTPTKAKIQKGSIALSEPISFDDSGSLTSQSIEVVQDLARVMRSYPAIRSIQVDGLVADAPSETVRADRVERIRAYMRTAGISPQALITQGGAFANTDQQNVPIVHVEEAKQNGLYFIQSFVK